MSHGGEQRKANDKSPGKHRARPITDKFDVYKVPLKQVQNPAAGLYGQYQQYQFQQQASNNNQPVYWTVPYNTLMYNYETYGYPQAPLGASIQTGTYPLPQMDPNYYNLAQGGGPYTPYGYSHSVGSNASGPQFSKPVSNYGRAPYASPWADIDSKQQPQSPPVPAAKQSNDDNEVMQKLFKMHGQMSKMVQLLTQEINAQRVSPRATPPPTGRPIEVGIGRFNQLLAKFNEECQTVKQQSQWQPGSSYSQTASSAFADKPWVAQAQENKSNPVGQAELAAKISQVDELYRQASALGVELHNIMLASIALPDPSQSYSSSSSKSP